MPFYNYVCSECGNEFQKLKKISEMDDPLKLPCPVCENLNTLSRIIGSPGFGEAVRLGLKKPGSEFRDLMTRIHKRTPGSNLDTSSTITKI